MIFPYCLPSQSSSIARDDNGQTRTVEKSASSLSRRRGFRFLAGAASLAILGIAHAAELTVIATGLKNPRGLDFAPNGALYIAEAGTGGSGPSLQGGDGAIVYFGLSGSVTRLWKGEQVRIIDGLPSLAALDGGSAGGPNAISFGKLGNAVLTIGLGLNPEKRALLGPQGAMMGKAYHLTPNGGLKVIADIAAYEAANDPDGNGPDSNPTGVLNEPAGTYISDAGANALFKVAANGDVSVVAVFPSRTFPTPPFLPKPPFGNTLSVQAVPTNVVRGPDGALYVSQLTGFPFIKGAANVYRVVLGSAPTVFAANFTNIIDLEFDAAGNLYVLEISTNGLLAPGPGRLARVNVDGTVETIVSAGLVMPGGMAIGPDGAIYISNYGTSPSGGQVVRVQP